MALAALGGAGASTNDQETLFKQDSLTCAIGGIPGPVTEGFVTFHHQGNTELVNVHLRGARPNATYGVVLRGTDCIIILFLGTITTDSTGVGDGIFAQAVSPTIPGFFIVVTAFTTLSVDAATPAAPAT